MHFAWMPIWTKVVVVPAVGKSIFRLEREAWFDYLGIMKATKIHRLIMRCEPTDQHQLLKLVNDMAASKLSELVRSGDSVINPLAAYDKYISSLSSVTGISARAAQVAQHYLKRQRLSKEDIWDILEKGKSPPRGSSHKNGAGFNNLEWKVDLPSASLKFFCNPTQGRPIEIPVGGFAVNPVHAAIGEMAKTLFEHVVWA